MNEIGYLGFCNDKDIDGFHDSIKQGTESNYKIFMKYVTATCDPHQFTKKYSVYEGMFDKEHIGIWHHNNLLKLCDPDTVITDGDSSIISKIFTYGYNICIVQMISLNGLDISKELFNYYDDMLDVYSVFILRQWWRKYAPTLHKLGIVHKDIKKICLFAQ